MLFAGEDQGDRRTVPASEYRVSVDCWSGWTGRWRRLRPLPHDESRDERRKDDQGQLSRSRHESGVVELGEKLEGDKADKETDCTIFLFTRFECHFAERSGGQGEWRCLSWHVECQPVAAILFGGEILVLFE